MNAQHRQTRQALTEAILHVETAHRAAQRREQQIIQTAQRRLVALQDRIADYQRHPRADTENDYLRWIRERGALLQVVARARR